MVDYRNEIKEILSGLVGDTISNDTNLADAGLDSLEIVEALLILENKFGVFINIEGDWMEDLVLTVDDLNRKINEKLHG